MGIVRPLHSKCVNELLFHLPKFSKMIFTTTKETALAPFNLAHPVGFKPKIKRKK